MRVIFNNFSSHRLRTGVGGYATYLLRELGPLAGDDSLTPFPSGWTERLFALGRRLPAQHSLVTSTDVHHSRPRLRRRIKAWMRDAGKRLVHESFRRACSRGRFDLYHEPNFSPWTCDIPAIATVHDLSALLHPEWHPADRVAQHEELVRTALPRLRHILTVSETIRREIIQHLGVEPDRVSAVPNGARADMRPMPKNEIEAARRRLQLPPLYLLHVGTIEPRKNVLMLLRAYCALDAALRDRCPLLLVGAWGWKFEPVRAYYEETGRHRGVRYFGYAGDADLPAVYNAALSLACPSHYEGFGLPPLEMLACGGPVLASTADAHREVLGRHAAFIAPDDEPGWHDALRRAITDADWRSELRRGAVQRASEFTWRKAAERTWGAYRQVAGFR